MKTKIIQTDFKKGYWFVYPDYDSDMLSFVLKLTDSKTLSEAHDKFSEVVGYEVDNTYLSPSLRSKKDAEKVINYFCKPFDDILFD